MGKFQKKCSHCGEEIELDLVVQSFDYPGYYMGFCPFCGHKETYIIPATEARPAYAVANMIQNMQLCLTI